MMSGHGANPIFFNKKTKVGRPEHLLAPYPFPLPPLTTLGPIITKVICLDEICEFIHSKTCSEEKVFWKFAANVQENTHAEVWFQ